MNNKSVWKNELNVAIASTDDIILYGAGVNAADYIIKCKNKYPLLNILCIADADINKKGKNLFGIPIVTPEGLKQYNKDACVIVTTQKYCFAITDKLHSLGFYNIFYISDYNALMVNLVSIRDEYIENNRVIMDSLLKNNADTISVVRNNLKHDEASIAVFEAKLNSSFSGQHCDIEALQVGDMYFPEGIISLSKNEVFIDCGGYDGKTTLDFVNRAGEYNYIYVLEPDSWQYEITKWILHDNNEISNCEIYKLGAYDSNEEVTFSSIEWGSSYINPHGECKIQTTTLDSLFFDKINHPTFIKMDIEGAELNALEGSRKLIVRDKPKFAISVYHGLPNTHLWEIPFWIISNYPHYKIYLRQHANINETVMYAI